MKKMMKKIRKILKLNAINYVEINRQFKELLENPGETKEKIRTADKIYVTEGMELNMFYDEEGMTLVKLKIGILTHLKEFQEFAYINGYKTSFDLEQKEKDGNVLGTLIVNIEKRKEIEK